MRAFCWLHFICVDFKVFVNMSLACLFSVARQHSSLWWWKHKHPLEAGAIPLRLPPGVGAAGYSLPLTLGGLWTGCCTTYTCSLVWLTIQYAICYHIHSSTCNFTLKFLSNQQHFFKQRIKMFNPYVGLHQFELTDEDRRAEMS